jgi:hypothetical protein
MDDASGLGRPQQDNDQLRHTLTIHEVGEQLSIAGVPRSERQKLELQQPINDNPVLSAERQG